MRVACLQMRSTTDLAENLATLEQMAGEAAAQGATYIQSPEMTSLIEKNPKRLLANSEADKGQNQVISLVQNLAKRYNIWLHIGSIAVRTDADKAANRGLLFSPDGTRVATYDKIHMFDVDLPNNESWRESALYQAGTEAVTARCEGFNLGMSICYDLRFPHLYRALSKAGANILSSPAAFTKQTGEAHWHTLLCARAIENGAFMIAAAQGGTHEDGRTTYGHSMIINPWGKIIAELDHDNPDILVCDIDLNEVSQARARIPALSNNQQFAITDGQQEQKN